MNEPIDRRQFGRQLSANAVAAVAGTCTGAASAGDEPKPAATDSDALLAVLKTRFPDRLSDEQWKEVRNKIDAQLKAGQTLSDFKLQNSDEPATVFVAYRKS